MIILSQYNTFRALRLCFDLCPSKINHQKMLLYIICNTEKKIIGQRNILIWSCLRCYFQHLYYIFWMSCRVASISSWSNLFFSRSTNISSVWLLTQSINTFEYYYHIVSIGGISKLLVWFFFVVTSNYIRSSTQLIQQ